MCIRDRRVSALLRRAQMASERRQSIGGTVLECDSLCITVNLSLIHIYLPPCAAAKSATREKRPLRDPAAAVCC